MADLNELQQSVEWLGARLTKVEDRVDRLYAQARIFTINSQALEDKWLSMGEQAAPGQLAAQGRGEAWLEEVTKALGVVWPLLREEPNREEMIHGRSTMPYGLSMRNCLIWSEWSLNGTRKTKVFTLVFRIGDTADRVERRLSATLNHALTQSNRTNGEPGVWHGGKNKRGKEEKGMGTPGQGGTR